MSVVFVWGDGWCTAAIICFAIFVAVMLFSFWIKSDNEKLYNSRRDAVDQRHFSRPWFWGGWVIAFVVLYICGVGISAAVSSSSEPDVDGTVNEVAAHFGLNSGQDHPLILGASQGSGVIGSAEAQGGLFGSSAVVDLRPTSTVLVGFQKDDRWWQLTLPSETTTFYKGAEQPTVSVKLVNATLDANEAYWDQTWSDCNWEYRNFWFVCQRSLEKREFIVSPYVDEQGLAALVGKYFSSAQIHLTDEQHSVLFPTN